MRKFSAKLNFKIVGLIAAILISLTGLILVICGETSVFKGGRHGDTALWIGIAFMIIGLIGTIFMIFFVGVHIKTTASEEMRVAEQQRYDFIWVLVQTLITKGLSKKDAIAYAKKAYNEEYLERVVSHGTKTKEQEINKALEEKKFHDLMDNSLLTNDLHKAVTDEDIANLQKEQRVVNTIKKDEADLNKLQANEMWTSRN